MLNNSDDHQADPLECSVTAHNFFRDKVYDADLDSYVYTVSEGETYSLSADSAVKKGYLDVNSRNVREDSAELEFSVDSDAAANAVPGDYYGTLTFRIALRQESYGGDGFNYGDAGSDPFYLHRNQ